MPEKRSKPDVRVAILRGDDVRFSQGETIADRFARLLPCMALVHGSLAVVV